MVAANDDEMTPAGMIAATKTPGNSVHPFVILYIMRLEPFVPPAVK
jgi:hypothetical protein